MTELQTRSYRIYFDFQERLSQGIPPEKQPRADLPPAPDLRELGHYGKLVYKHFKDNFPDFLAYLEHHGQILDYLLPLEREMTDASHLHMEQIFAQFNLPKWEMRTREETEARVALIEYVEFELSQGRDPDPIAYSNYVNLGMNTRNPYDGNPEPYAAIADEYQKPVEYQTMKRFIYCVFPLPEDEDGVPFN